MNTLIQLDSTLFTWLNWRADSIHSLGLRCRYKDITSERGKKILRKYVIGWCRGESLLCRPKEKEIAVMYFKDDVEFWFHIRRNEFNKVFIY